MTTLQIIHEDFQAPPVTGSNPPQFNIGHAPTPPWYEPFVPLRQQPPVSFPCRNPPRVRNPPVRPDNIYGTGRPVDIEREIEREREWTHRVLQEGTPRFTHPPAQPEQAEPMPAERPLSPLPPLLLHRHLNLQCPILMTSMKARWISTH